MVYSREKPIAPANNSKNAPAGKAVPGSTAFVPPVVGLMVDTGWNSYNTYKNGKHKYGGTQIRYFDPTNTVLSYDHCVRTCETRDYYAALD